MAVLIVRKIVLLDKWTESIYNKWKTSYFRIIHFYYNSIYFIVEANIYFYNIFNSNSNPIWNIHFQIPYKPIVTPTEIR